jgi:hypothetical protein
MVDYSRHEWLVSNQLKVQVKLKVPQGILFFLEWLKFEGSKLISSCQSHGHVEYS